MKLKYCLLGVKQQSLTHSIDGSHHKAEILLIYLALNNNHSLTHSLDGSHHKAEILLT
jgi:ribosomal protein S5